MEQSKVDLRQPAKFARLLIGNVTECFHYRVFYMQNGRQLDGEEDLVLRRNKGKSISTATEEKKQ